jgi:hypothetical protein
LILWTDAEREFLEAHKQYVAAMRTVDGPTDQQAERLEAARKALNSEEEAA